jgi:hypothetical protein
MSNEEIKEISRNDIKTQEDANTKAFQRLNNRLKQIRELTNAETEEAEEERNNLALSIQKEYIVEIQLSTGGDADGFKLFFSKDKELLRGVFYWADWGQYAERSLTEEELNEINDFFYAEGVLND